MIQRVRVNRWLTVVLLTAGLSSIVLRMLADQPAAAMDEKTPGLTPLTAAALESCPNTVKWARELSAWGVHEEDARKSLEEQARKLLEPPRGGIIVGEQPTDVCKKLTCADVEGKKAACVVDGVLEEVTCQKKAVKGKLLRAGREAAFEVYWCTGKVYYGCFCES